MRDLMPCAQGENMERDHDRRVSLTLRSWRREMGVREAKRRRPTLEGLEARQLLSVSEFSVAQAENNNAFALPLAITKGPDGNIWFADQQTGKIGKIDPTSHQITFPPNQPAASSSPSGITTGPDGNIWFTETALAQIGMINVATGALTEFGASAGMSNGAGPFGIAAGPDGNIWFTEASHTNGKIGMLDL